jgi:hypothetical protein
MTFLRDALPLAGRRVSERADRRSGRFQSLYHAGAEYRRCLAARPAGPWHGAEFVGHEGLGVAGGIDHGAKDEGRAVGHGEGAPGGEFAFDAKIALAPRLRRRGNHRQDKCARGDLAADFSILGVAADEFSPVEPDLDPGSPPRGAHRSAASASCDA